MRFASFGAVVVGMAVVAVACGGATGSDITEGNGSTSGGSTSSGATSSSSGSTSSSSSGSTSSSSSGSTSSSSSGSTSSSSSSSSGSLPKACTPTGGQCSASEYCDAPGCGNGTCKTRPTETGELGPACGCDGVTYFNPSVAYKSGVSVRAAGVCSPPTLTTTCTGNCADGPGGAKRYCAQFVPAGIASCNVVTPVKRCWAIPETCTAKLQARACVGGTECKSPCDLIKDGRASYLDTSGC